MKRHLIYLLFAATFFAGCEKEDGPIPADVALERVPQPQLVKESTGSQAIDMLNLPAFKGKFTVGLYSATDIPPTKFDVMVMKNSDRTKVKLFKADVATFPTSLEVTVAQLNALFGVPVALNDNYDFGVDIYTQSGKKFAAFPELSKAVGFGSGIAAQPGSSTTARFSAICAYDANIYQGNFVVVKDDWADTNPGDIIVFTKIDATHFSYIYPTALNPIPIIVTVNTADNGVSVAKQTIGSLWDYGSPVYVLPWAATTGGASVNYVAPCDKTVTLNMQYGYSSNTFGGVYPFILKKQ